MEVAMPYHRLPDPQPPSHLPPDQLPPDYQPLEAKPMEISHNKNYALEDSRINRSSSSPSTVLDEDHDEIEDPADEDYEIESPDEQQGVAKNTSVMEDNSGRSNNNEERTQEQRNSNNNGTVVTKPNDATELGVPVIEQLLKCKSTTRKVVNFSTPSSASPARSGASSTETSSDENTLKHQEQNRQNDYATKCPQPTYGGIVPTDYLISNTNAVKENINEGHINDLACDLDTKQGQRNDLGSDLDTKQGQRSDDLDNAESRLPVPVTDDLDNAESQLPVPVTDFDLDNVKMTSGANEEIHQQADIENCNADLSTENHYNHNKLNDSTGAGCDTKLQQPVEEIILMQQLSGDDKEDGDRSGGSNSPTNVEDLASQLFQLQGLVKDMRDGLTSAMDALTLLAPENNASLEQKINANKQAHDQQLADVLNMVLALKGEFSMLTGQLAVANETQTQLRSKVDLLQYERDILLEELETYGVVSEKVRQKYHSGRKRPNGLTRANDSTLSVLLERARTVFNSNNGNSDQDSGVNTGHQGDTSTCGEVTPPNVSPMVQSYIAGLPHDNHVEGPIDENYDSDSSITAAANKSLDMSRSLGDKCAELTNVSSSDEEEEMDSQRREKSASKNGETRKLSPNTQAVNFKRPASPKRTPPHEKSAMELARSRVGREILETERKYCSCLWTILDHFANPLRESGIVPAKELNVMFPECLTRIYEHHCAFLQKLEERIANWRWHGVIGDVFSAFIDSSDYDVLIQYRSYVNEFPAALNQLKKSCRHSLRFRKFLRKCQQDPVCEGLDLAAFLLTPVQRIPRYVLLLKQMLKYTAPEHIDYYYVEACLAKLRTFLTQLNDSIEYSMKVVANDTTPKPKRKLRVGSMRSSASSEGGHAMTSRDSGVMSAGDNTSILSNSSNGRMFQLSLLKEGVPERPLGVPNSSQAPHSSFAGSGAPYDTRTMPSMGTRRQRERLRRPNSSDPQGEFDLGNGDLENRDAVEFVAPQHPPPRSRSFVESKVSRAYQQQVAIGRQIPVSGVSPFRVTSPTHSGNPAGIMRGSVSMKNINSEVDMSRHLYSPNDAGNHGSITHSTPYTANVGLHKSLSHIPMSSGFGVFGSDEGEENGERAFSPTSELSDTGANNNVPQQQPRRTTKLLSHRSRSQGHLIGSNHKTYTTLEDSTDISYTNHQHGGITTGATIIKNGAYNYPQGGSTGGGGGSNTPSQPRINLALAHSLSDDSSTADTPRHYPHSRHQYPINNSVPGGSSKAQLQRPKSCLIPTSNTGGGGGGPGDNIPTSPVSLQGVNTSTISSNPSGGSLMSGMRPRATSLTHGGTIVPTSPNSKNRPRENVWDDSTTSINDTSTLSVADLVGKQKGIGLGRRKKKDPKKKLEESITSENGRKKTTGIKDSIKNMFFKKRKSDKDKQHALRDVLADNDLLATSIKFPLRDQTSSLNLNRSSSARSPKSPTPSNQGTLVVRNGQITIEHVAENGEMAEIGRKFENEAVVEESRKDGKSKKRPHSVCYGAVTCTPQEKKSSLRGTPSRSSLASKVVEIGSQAGLDHSASPNEVDQSASSSMSPRQAAPPIDDSLIVPSMVGPPQPDFSTYEDENGDPCSAV